MKNNNIKIFLLFIIILFFIIFTIKNNKNEKIFKESLECPQNQTLNKNYSLILIDTLNIPTENNEPKYFSSFCLKNNTFLYGGGINDNKIYVYDLSTCKFIKKININFKKVSSIYGISVLNKDSIFVVKDYPPQIILIDSNGKIIEIRKDLEKIKNINLESRYKKIGFLFPVFLFYQNPVFDKNNNFHISIDFESAFDLKKYINIPRIGVYNFNKNIWLNFYSKNVGIYRYKNENYSYPYDLLFPWILIRDTIVYVSYPMDHYVYTYGLDGCKLINEYSITPENCESIPEPIKKSKASSCQKSWNFRIKTSFYGPVFFHRKTKLFTRIFHYSQNLIDENGLLNNGKNRKSSIIIFDTLMNIVGEKIFYNGELGVYKYIPLEDGFLVAKEQDSLGNYLDYKYLYKFKKNDF